MKELEKQQQQQEGEEVEMKPSFFVEEEGIESYLMMMLKS